MWETIKGGVFQRRAFSPAGAEITLVDSRGRLKAKRGESMDPVWFALAFGAVEILVFACFAVLAHWYVDQQKRKIRDEISELVRAFITAPDDQTPSPLACLIDQGSLLLAARMVQQLKAMLAGTESGLSKAEGLEKQLSMLDDAPPWASIVLGILPKRLRSQLLKNPQMIGALSSFKPGNGAGSPGSAGGSVAGRLRHNQ